MLPEFDRKILNHYNEKREKLLAQKQNLIKEFLFRFKFDDGTLVDFIQDGDILHYYIVYSGQKLRFEIHENIFRDGIDSLSLESVTPPSSGRIFNIDDLVDYLILNFSF